MSFGAHHPLTPADEVRFAAIKEIGCVVARARGIRVPILCEVHHLKSGNLVRGHQYTVGLSPWTHRAVPFDRRTHRECRDRYGPSLAEGVLPFRAYLRELGIGDGSDDALLDWQHQCMRAAGFGRLIETPPP